MNNSNVTRMGGRNWDYFINKVPVQHIKQYTVKTDSGQFKMYSENSSATTKIFFRKGNIIDAMWQAEQVSQKYPYPNPQN